MWIAWHGVLIWAAIPTGLIFAGILLLLSQLIHIPFSAYATFVIEEKYGFNRTTVKTFIMDIFKSWLLMAVIGGVVFSIVLWFFEKTGTWAWLYCWGAMIIIQLFLSFIAPVVIMPIFNKFYPLEESELKSTIEDYARAQKFKIKGVFKMDASKRSSKSNAFFTGFGKFRRIVLFDTLIEKHTVDELVSVLAHEMGHYKKKHIITSMIISILTTGLMFFILSLFLNNRDCLLPLRWKTPPSTQACCFLAFCMLPLKWFSPFLATCFPEGMNTRLMLTQRPPTVNRKQ